MRIGERELRLLVQIAGKRDAGGGRRQRVVFLAQGRGAGGRAPLGAGVVGKGGGFPLVKRIAGALRLVVLVDLDFAVAGIESGNIRLAIRVNGDLRGAARGGFVAIGCGKERIFADLVFDVGLQLQRGKLQKLDRLPQLRRDHQLLGLTRLKP